MKIWQILVCLMYLCSLVCAEKSTLHISAQSLSANLNTGLIELNGKVVATKASDKLLANSVIIESKHNKPLKYTAIGNVEFFANDKDKQMRGKALKAIYNVLNDEYQLLDSAELSEIGTDNVIKGNSIIFSAKAQSAYVKGSKQKPSSVTLSIEQE